jgi:hypothetical protein
MRLAPEEPDQDEDGEDDEDADAPPSPADGGRDHDRCEVADCPDHEAVGLGLAAERVPHQIR